MRFAIVAAAMVLPLLAACSNDQPPAPTANTPAAPATERPAAPARPAAVNVPTGAVPLIGTWAPGLDSCSNSEAVTVITATTFASPARSCDISLQPTQDGSFTTRCGNATMTLTPVFAPTGEGVNVVVGEERRQTVLRCTR